jgi:hypothetical protein
MENMKIKMEEDEDGRSGSEQLKLIYQRPPRLIHVHPVIKML